MFEWDEIESPFGSSMKTPWDICNPEAIANRNTHSLIWIWERPGKASHWGFNEGCGRNDWLLTTNIVYAWKLGHWCYLPTTNDVFSKELGLIFSDSMLTNEYVHVHVHGNSASKDIVMGLLSMVSRVQLRIFLIMDPISYLLHSIFYGFKASLK